MKFDKMIEKTGENAMDKKQAQEIRNQYDEYDTNFRRCKKNGDFKRASAWKSKRDALENIINEAIKVLAEK